MIQVKRIYDPVLASDGKRILVDRLWPRGLSKENAALHEWMKELAPSHELRKWYNHDIARFEEFKEKYREELVGDESKAALFKRLLHWSADGTVTLLYSAKNEERNQAVVLAEWLDSYERS
jgi:uncharacterized protein YeaO (DUF488 family)